jgi:HAD superfamily phosphatase (TIGR01668 family)
MTFVPEYYFNAFSEVSAEFLLSIGIKGILLDIDNTLEPYEHSKPGERVVAWFEELKAAGISAAFISNNNSQRVNLFNESLNFPAYSKAGKPFKKNLINAMRDLGTDSANTIFMGDQIFTDVMAAHNAGIPAILVPPINDKKDLFTKFKRLLEKPFLKKYFKNKEKGR